jgi:hypothetical protein
LARGQFVGIDRLTHLHVLEDSHGAVLIAYNLGSEEVHRSVTVDLSVLGLDVAPEVTSSPPAALTAEPTDKGALVLKLQIAPLSPVIVEIGTGQS